MKYFLFNLIMFSSIYLSGQKTIALDFDEISKASKSSARFDNAKSNFQFNIIDIPMPNGEVIEFAVRHSPLVSKDNPLYEGPAGQTYSIHSPVTPGYNGSFILYKNGIHATLNTPDGLLFIKREKIEGRNDNHIFTYFKDTNGFPHSAHDAVKSHLPTDKSGKKHSHDGEEEHVHEMPSFLQANNNFFTVGAGNTRKTLDLFIVSDKSFLDQYSGNTTNATNRVTEVVNGVKAVWEQDFNITINYMGVYFNSTMITAGIPGSGTIWNNVADGDVNGGTKNDVDLVHFMAGNGGGGAGGLWVACGSSKQDGYSGTTAVADASYIPLVAHEMAHQMGADHTWTGSDQNCTTGQWGKNSGVEPGAGVTLAGYAGICGTDNIPGAGKGNYHHIESLREIVIYANSGMGKNFSQTTITAAGQIPAYDEDKTLPSCITSTTYNNNIPIANANADNITNIYLPTNTPFELNGSATDGDNDPLTYQWDQLDFALVQQPLDGYANRADGPLFRSYGPKSKTKREFPKLEDILSNTQVKGEILPLVARPMRFALVVRDGKGGVGVDTFGLQVVNTGSAFSITESINVSNPSSVTVNWNVANTTAAPISCANVDILYSVDGGETFPHTLVGPTPNDGSHIVDLSSYGNTANGRIKVRGTNRVFFDINNSNLNIAPVGCTAQSSQICNPDIISVDSGDNMLDLDENKHLLGGASSTSKTITVSNSEGASITDNGGTCAESNFPGEYFGTFEFTVSTTGQYTITGPSAIAILQTSGYTYNAANPCNNSGTFIGANFTQAGSGQALSPTLTACTKYTAVVSSQSAGASTTINFSGSGNIISSDAAVGGTSYTYIGVDSSNSQIVKVDANADFKSLSGGKTYFVYGVSYLSSINTAAWVGMTTSQALSVSTCAFKSTNKHILRVTGAASSPCNAANTKTVVQNEIATDAVFHDGTISSGAAGAGKVTVSANNVTFRAVSAVNLNSEFEVTTPNVFTVEIAPCPVMAVEAEHIESERK